VTFVCSDKCLNTGRQLDRQLQDYGNGLIEAQNICLEKKKKNKQTNKKKNSASKESLSVWKYKTNSVYTNIFGNEQLIQLSHLGHCMSWQVSHFISRL